MTYLIAGLTVTIAASFQRPSHVPIPTLPTIDATPRGGVAVESPSLRKGTPMIRIISALAAESTSRPCASRLMNLATCSAVPVKLDTLCPVICQRGDRSRRRHTRRKVSPCFRYTAFRYRCARHKEEGRDRRLDLPLLR